MEKIVDGFMLEDELGDVSRTLQATWRFTVNWQRESLLLPRIDGVNWVCVYGLPFS